MITSDGRIPPDLPGSAARDVLNALLSGCNPRHHRPQLRAYLLDGVLGRGVAHAIKVRASVLVLRNPLACEVARLDFTEDLLHLRLRLRRDDARAPRHLAVLRSVTDGVVHRRDAALVDEVDDQLHLVQRLEVCALRLVTRFDERLEAVADQLDQTAAEYDLLAEEIRLGL